MILLLLVLVSLFWFSNQNGQISTSQSDGVLDGLRIQTSSYEEHRNYTLIIRKTAHVSIYFIIGILIYLIIENPKYVLIGVFLIACSDELHQLMVPGRSGRILDVFIDLFGGLLAIAAYNLTCQIKKKLTSN
nr:VanZ family protein [Acidaminobacter sp. JC074]